MPTSRAEDPLGRAYRRRPGFSTRGEAEECILVPAADAGERPDSLRLNRVGAWIWERLDGSRSGALLVEALMAEFDVERQRAERDYGALVERLLELGALEPAGRDRD